MKKEAAKKNTGKKAEKKTEKKVEKINSKNTFVERVATGIPNFDRLIEGGFEKNSTNLLVGDSGAGKSIFAAQFLMEGVKKGDKCLYITFEEKKEQFYLNMREFGWELEEYEKKGLFIFLEYSPIKVKTMLEEGGGEVESLILKNKVTRIVIDSITSFELLFEDELAKREAALELFGLIRDWECTALLTLEENASPSADFTSRALKFESDSMIVLYFPRKGKMRKRFVEVLKMRGTKHSKEVYPFDITDKGISIDKNPASDFLTNEN
jgi:circadian clock protein KaiC